MCVKIKSLALPLDHIYKRYYSVVGDVLKSCIPEFVSCFQQKIHHVINICLHSASQFLHCSCQDGRIIDISLYIVYMCIYYWSG